MFKLLKQSKKSKARLGRLKTAHGIIQTPFFMPIATRAAVKNLTPEELKIIGAQVILSNTYHLFLRPGTKVIQKHKGLHEFMHWPGPILTDSGGYQVFSLSHRRKVTDKEVQFRSEIDGQSAKLTPAKVIQIQSALNSDIMMVLDEPIAYPANIKTAQQAVNRTTLWAKQSLGKRKNKKQLLFGIVQGSVYTGLRKKSAQELVKLGFDGYAIGGLTVGEPIKQTYQIIKIVEEELPEDKPRYLMGAGKPDQIVQAVKLGIDMFDCVIPTRNARHGMIYIWNSKINSILNTRKKFFQEIKITNSKYQHDLKPLEQGCKCYACRNFTRAYLRHLFMTKEPLGQRLVTCHNLYFYLSLMKKIRQELTKE